MHRWFDAQLDQKILDGIYLSTLYCLIYYLTIQNEKNLPLRGKKCGRVGSIFNCLGCPEKSKILIQLLWGVPKPPLGQNFRPDRDSGVNPGLKQTNKLKKIPVFLPLYQDHCL